MQVVTLRHSRLTLTLDPSPPGRGRQQSCVFFHFVVRPATPAGYRHTAGLCSDDESSCHPISLDKTCPDLDKPCPEVKKVKLFFTEAREGSEQWVVTRYRLDG